MELNFSIFHWLHSFAHQSAFLDAMIRFAADPLGILLVLVVAGYLYVHHAHAHGLWELGAFFGVAFLAAGIAYLLKEFFPTLRPSDYVFPLNPLIEVGGAAFPSMHTAFYSAFGGAMVVTHRKSGLLVICLALVIGTGRVMAGVHWPMDIMFGVALGVAVGWSAMRLCYEWVCRILKVCVPI